MKKAVLFMVTFLIAGSFLAADSVIVEFHAMPGFNKVNLNWKVSQETNVKGYQVERGTDGRNFIPIDFVKATVTPATSANPKSYTYVDRSIFKPTGRTFYYRLAIKDIDSDAVVSYSSVVVASPQISGVHHTWGSIKAMFR